MGDGYGCKCVSFVCGCVGIIQYNEVIYIYIYIYIVSVYTNKT